MENTHTYLKKTLIFEYEKRIHGEEELAVGKGIIVKGGRGEDGVRASVYMYEAVEYIRLTSLG